MVLEAGAAGIGAAVVLGEEEGEEEDDECRHLYVEGKERRSKIIVNGSGFSS